MQTQKAVSLLLVVSLASFSLHLDTVDKGFGLQQDPSVTLHGGSCGENSVMTPDLWSPARHGEGFVQSSLGGQS